MKIGISTSWDFLSGNHKFEESQLTLKSFDSVESYMQFVKELGVTSIELRNYDPELTKKDIRDVCKTLKAHNLGLTVHGEIFESNFNLAFDETFPWLNEVLDFYSDQPLIIIVHPIEGESATLEEYRQMTLTKLSDITEMLHRHNLNVKIAFEINQFVTTLTSPGFTYDGVLDIVNEINSEKLGICFDFGHTWSNIRREFLDKIIPDAFLNRVIHTHIHDLSSEYQTHWPLTFGNVPIDNYINLLLAKHYDGVLNLELVYNRFKKSIDAKKAIESSLQRLNSIVNSL